MEIISIAIGIDSLGWWKKFAEALEAKQQNGFPIDYKIINVEADSWIDDIKPFDVLIWKPAYLGSEIVGYFKEKIYFIQNVLKKTVIPNYDSIWHYDSKIAQSYLFRHFGIPSPKTVVSFDLSDARELITKAEMPVVYKKSWGAASKNVELIKTKTDGMNLVSRLFFQSEWENIKKDKNKYSFHLLMNLQYPWFWHKVIEKFSNGQKLSDRFGVIYWQEFIKDNSADLRITVIGNKYAYGFWRNNRINDFRASGSGKLDYDKVIPSNLILECVSISKLLNFDSMAYDILFKNGEFVINEISYAYVDTACFNANGYYVVEDDKIEFISIHTWPQHLWVEWVFERINSLINENS